MAVASVISGRYVTVMLSPPSEFSLGANKSAGGWLPHKHPLIAIEINTNNAIKILPELPPGLLLAHA